MAENGYQPDMRKHGNTVDRRDDKQRLSPHMFIGAAEIFTCGSDEEYQRQYIGDDIQRVPGIDETVLGAVFLGKRLFCEQRGYRR